VASRPAEVRWAADAIEGSELVVLAIPLTNSRPSDASLVADKPVIDTMNYSPPGRPAPLS